MGLVLKDKICLDTPLGVSEVQLLFGDITQLPMEDKVDIIFVSAFPGDYYLVPGTMVHALHRNLGLSLAALAKDKETDLRSMFNCWLSKPLPDHLPFRQVVCFEMMNRVDKVADQISGVFRAMMPIFNNQDKSVITPLLATGNQHHSEREVLRAIVTAACHWIQAGLPLRCLKIVKYTTAPKSKSSEENALLALFSKLKTKWETKQKKEEVGGKETKKYDVCLSFSEGDEVLVSKVCSDLIKAHKTIIIHNTFLPYDHDLVWQDNIFDVMVQSHRVVVILTPNYVDKKECLEQFNLALCCNRLTGVDVVAPFYLQTVEAIPSYMMLIQYTECRARKEGENAEDKIFAACTMLVKAIDLDKTLTPRKGSASSDLNSDKTLMPRKESVSSNRSQSAAKPSASSTVYDIFISYAHKTPKEAMKMYDDLFDISPDLKVFLDRSELRTGNSWQEALYEGVDKAKVVVAFITRSYIQSTVCQEEYNIALARYMSQDGIIFLPLLVDMDLTEVPAMLSGAPLVDMSCPSKLFEEQSFNLADAPIRWLEAQRRGEAVLNIFCVPEPNKTSITHVTENWRKKDFDRRFKLVSKGKNKSIQLKQASAPSESRPEFYVSALVDPMTVVFSFAADSFEQAVMLSHLLKKQDKVGVTCEFLPVDQTVGMQAPRVQLLDTADMVVVMVSDDYLQSSQKQHELHIALCRQRVSKDKRVVYLMDSQQHTQRRPLYAHLLPFSVGLGDQVWLQHAATLHSDQAQHTVVVSGSHSVKVSFTGNEYAAFSAAAQDIADKLLAGSTEKGSGMPTNIVNLITLMENKRDFVPASKCLVPFSLLMKESHVAEDSSEAPLSLPSPPTFDPEDDAETGEMKALTSKNNQEIKGSGKTKETGGMPVSTTCPADKGDHEMSVTSGGEKSPLQPVKERVKEKQAARTCQLI